MSVVNQMLRDLDARRAKAAEPLLEAGLAPVSRRRRASPWVARGAVALGASALLGAGVLGTVGGASAEAPAAAAVAVAAPSAVAAKPIATVRAVTPAPQAVPAEPLPLPAREEANAAPPHASVAPAPARTPATRATRVALAVPLARATPPKVAATSAPMPAASAPEAVVPPASAALPAKQFALVDRVPAARELWSAGHGEAAIALLREALAAPTSDATGRAAAARELARLELLSRDPAGALQTLDRHAADLRGDAQAWALRGNAAQRLGRHDDAVAAFEAAVRLHGEDTRSMLGAAVSLAAAGDTARARQWAERARQAGGIPPDVLAYLGRLGVTIER